MRKIVTAFIALLCYLTTILLIGCATASNSGGFATVSTTQALDQNSDSKRADMTTLRLMSRAALDDVELNNYLTTLLNRLESARGAPCNCSIIADAFGGYEAYTFPNNTIVISAGAIAQIKYEDELVALISHELAHVYNGDTQKAKTQEFSTAALRTVMGAAAFSGATIGIASHLLSDSSEIFMDNVVYLQWNQEQEAEADRFGIELMAKAGYSPTGMKTAIRKLNEYASHITFTTAACKSLTGGGKIDASDVSCNAANLLSNNEGEHGNVESRFNAVSANCKKLSVDIRRREMKPMPKRFESADYLLSLSKYLDSYLSNGSAVALRNANDRFLYTQLPKSIQENGAVLSQLRLLAEKNRNQERYDNFTVLMLACPQKTADNYYQLLQRADVRRDRDAVIRHIDQMHSDFGQIQSMIPIEFYLATKYGLPMRQLEMYAKCLSLIAMSASQYKLCTEVERLGKHGNYKW